MNAKILKFKKRKTASVPQKGTAAVFAFPKQKALNAIIKTDIDYFEVRR